MTLTRKILLAVLIVMAIRGIVSIGLDTYRFFIADDSTIELDPIHVTLEPPAYTRFKDSVTLVEELRKKKMDLWIEAMQRNPDSVRRADSVEAVRSDDYTTKLIDDLRKAHLR